MLWIVSSILAALFQTIRTAIQKHLKKSLSTNAINWSRYSFGLPFVILYVFGLHNFGKYQLPVFGYVFILYSIGAAISQIIGTGLLISLFDRRNFAVGTTYAKTESLQTAFLGLALFAEMLTFIGFLAILIGAIGIMMISLVEDKVSMRNLIKAMGSQTALIGIASGTAFSFAGLFIRQATLCLDQPFLMNAGFTLLTVMLMQFFLLGLWILYKNRACFYDISRNLKLCSFVGLFSTLGSIGWFTAFALANAAYVKTVGQIELLFSVFITHHFFEERINKLEAIGMVFVVASIILLIMG